MRVMCAVRRNAYFDSIDLMRVAEQARQLAGVAEVAVVMGTPPGRAMLAAAGMWPPQAPEAGPSDVLISVRASTEAVASRAVASVEELLDASREPGQARADMAPRTTAVAARSAVTNVAVIAVPGAYAAVEAHQAISAGLHVFLFSDGVSLNDEVALKRRARDRRLLVMGPECGTAIINGVGLGFANRVRRGPIGVVGASGTGIQELTTLVHRLGGGISHAIGTGGRDLHADVGGLTTLQAVAALGADPGTQVLLVVSKPPSPAAADAVLRAAVATQKPVVACLLGYHGATPQGVRTTTALDEAAIVAVKLAVGGVRELERPAVPAASARGAILGLFAGGTLCDEARRIAGDGAGHRFVDFGAEEYTRGRPHPIIDPSQRNAAIVAAGDDAKVSVLLLDLVLGDCAHADPAGALRPALGEERARRRGRDLAIVAHVVGTDEDPQDLERQEGELRKLGVVVCASNRIAAETARAIAEGRDAV
jgi:FdrA protein